MKHFLKKSITCLALTCIFSSYSYAEKIYFQKITALGTEISTQFKTENPEQAQFCAKVADDEVTRLEKLLSAYKEDSDISKLGKADGRWIPVSKDTYEILVKARDIAQHTDGAMDPTVGAIVKLWAVDQPNRRVPSQEEIEAALKFVDWQQIGAKEENGQYFAKIGKGQQITVGAIGKGFIADKVDARLKQAGCQNALVSLGGNIIAHGTNQENEPWIIGIQEPDSKRGSYYGTISLDDASLVTSGDYEKFFVKDGKKYHHILNPKTGWPVPATLSSVTILDKNSAFADGMCTALFVMGWDGAIKYLEEHPGIHAVLIDEPMERLAVTANLRDELEVNDGRFRRQIIWPIMK